MSRPRYIQFGGVEPEGLPQLLEFYHTDLLRLFANGISFGDNINCDIVTAQFNSDVAPVRLSLKNLKTPPLSVWVMSASERGSDRVMSGNQVTWNGTGGSVNVYDISGLTPSTIYNVKFLLVGG